MSEIMPARTLDEVRTRHGDASRQLPAVLQGEVLTIRRHQPGESSILHEDDEGGSCHADDQYDTLFAEIET